MIKRRALGCLRLDAKNVRYHRGNVKDAVEGPTGACCIQANLPLYQLPGPSCSVTAGENKSSITYSPKL